MMALPEEFLERMKELLGEEFPSFLASYENEVFAGLRMNRLKTGEEQWLSFAGETVTGQVSPVPWVENGYFYPEDCSPAKHPFYAAGLFYLQEPSAMTPASRLPVDPGMAVLDLCAAPGGKATELAGKLAGRGWLLANDLSASRAKALAKNLEMAGAANVFVTAESPEKLSTFYPGVFDRILIDAPCSGEGMFRKEPSMCSYWEANKAESYVEVQAGLLKQASHMLKEGGYLLYSTCTFSPSENELQILAFLKAHPEFHTVPVTPYEGFTPGFFGLTDSVRIFPHRMDGEGHFLVLLKKEAADTASEAVLPYGDASGTADESRITAEQLFGDLQVSCKEELVQFFCRREGKGKKRAGKSSKASASGSAGEISGSLAQRLRGCAFFCEQEQIYALFPGMERKKKLRYIKTGLHLGSAKKQRFEPSQALALWLKKEEYPYCLDLDPSDDRVLRYLKGETLSLTENENFPASVCVLLCTAGFPLGWAKEAGGRLKNKYHPAWIRPN